jgi:hypothetical protein
MHSIVMVHRLVHLRFPNEGDVGPGGDDDLVPRPFLYNLVQSQVR